MHASFQKVRGSVFTTSSSAATSSAWWCSHATTTTSFSPMKYGKVDIFKFAMVENFTRYHGSVRLFSESVWLSCFFVSMQQRLVRVAHVVVHLHNVLLSIAAS